MNDMHICKEFLWKLYERYPYLRGISIEIVRMICIFERNFFGNCSNDMHISKEFLWKLYERYAYLKGISIRILFNGNFILKKKPRKLTLY
jgi:hypothetical protein